jgi:diaminopimelate epimerase
MRNVTFKKFSGAGNDFILIDKKEFPDLILNESQIQKICDRRRGVGADGILLIDKLDGFDFSMRYYNSDGSLGSLCGNGARCAIKYAALSGRIEKFAKFECNNEKFKGEIISDNLVKFYFNNPTKIKRNFRLKVWEQLINASFADTGSPHVVILIDDVLQNPKDLKSNFTNLYKFPVEELGREIRFHKDFQPEGVNVNFISLDKEFLHIRTYERGVENETYACGTGSVASAIISSLNYNLKPPIELKTFGGDVLTVDFYKDNDGISDVSLTGPAEMVFKGEIIL